MRPTAPREQPPYAGSRRRARNGKELRGTSVSDTADRLEKMTSEA